MSNGNIKPNRVTRLSPGELRQRKATTVSVVIAGDMTAAIADQWEATAPNTSLTFFVNELLRRQLAAEPASSMLNGAYRHAYHAAQVTVRRRVADFCDALREELCGAGAVGSSEAATRAYEAAHGVVGEILPPAAPSANPTHYDDGTPILGVESAPEPIADPIEPGLYGPDQFLTPPES